jgi:hypothetical protein
MREIDSPAFAGEIDSLEVRSGFLGRDCSGILDWIDRGEYPFAVRKQPGGS